jgi:hypothetical protein
MIDLGISKIIAIAGLIFIIIGVVMSSSEKNTKKKHAYIILAIGGICLEIYSIYIKDPIFIILQGVFVISSIYGWVKSK